MFILEYRRDETRRTTFGSLFGAMRSRQGSTATSRRLHVATSPSHDVEVNYYRSQPVPTSRRHHVATSPCRDVITSRRQLKIQHLIIKCEGARESRVLKSVRPETRIWRPATLIRRFFLDFCIGFSLFLFDYFLDHMMVFFIFYILFISFMMF